MPFYITFLYLVTTFALAFIAVRVVRKAPRSAIQQSFLLFSLGAILWIWSLYSGYFFARSGTEDIALFSTRLTFGFGLMALGFIIRFIYLYPKVNFAFSKVWKRAFTLVFLTVALFASFTPYVYEAQIYVDALTIKDKIGDFYGIFAATFIEGFLFFNWFALKKIAQLQGIEKKKLQIFALGAFLTLAPIILIYMVLPLFDLYVFQAEIACNVFVFSASVLYGMQKYRFLDIKLNLLQAFKVVAAMVPTLAIVSALFSVSTVLLKASSLTATALSSVVALFIYPFFLKLLHSDAFHHFFGFTKGEYFIRQISEFQSKALIYKTISELRKALVSLFCQKLKINTVELIILHQKNKKIYLSLIQYFEQNHEILVRKEIPYRKDVKSSLASKLQLRIEVYLPIYHLGSTHLIGFLMLSQKERADIYSQEEVQAIESLKPFLSLQLSALLYQQTLQTAIKSKTRELDLKYEVEQTVGSTLAHEIKTPLAIVKNAFFMLLATFEDFKYHIPQNTWKELQNISYSAEQGLSEMKQICESLLLMREVELQKKVYLHEFNPYSQFDQILQHYQKRAEEKGLKFIVEASLQNEKKYGAGMQFEQVLAILLDNAVKYTKSGTITLKLSQSTKKLYCSVKDTGMGIEEEKRKVIFERFYRDRNERNENLSGIPGLGVGLYIAAKVVKHMKGSLRVKDNPEAKGIEFTVEMPIYNTVQIVRKRTKRIVK